MKYDLNENKEVVRLNEDVGFTIFQQLGGRKFTTMMGVKTPAMKMKNGITFRFKAKAKDGINGIKIILTGADLYDITFSKMRGMDYKVVDEIKGVYAEDLKSTIEARTGLRLSL